MAANISYLKRSIYYKQVKNKPFKCFAIEYYSIEIQYIAVGAEVRGLFIENKPIKLFINRKKGFENSLFFHYLQP